MLCSPPHDGSQPRRRHIALAGCVLAALVPLAAAGAGWANWPLAREITGTWEVANPEAKHLLRGVHRLHLHANGTAVFEGNGPEGHWRWSLNHSRFRLREVRTDRDEPGVIFSRRRRSADAELTVHHWERKPARLVLKTDFPKSGEDIVLVHFTPTR